MDPIVPSPRILAFRMARSVSESHLAVSGQSDIKKYATRVQPAVMLPSTMKILYLSAGLARIGMPGGSYQRQLL